MNKIVNGVVVEMTPEEVAEREAAEAEYNSGALDRAKAAKQAEIITGADAFLNALAASYSQGEKLSWPKQEAEALSLVANAEAPAPLLRGIAQIRGIALATLRDKVLANVAEYEQATAYVLGTQQHFADLLAAATTVQEVQAIEVSYA